MRVFFGILIVVLSLAASADAQERRRIRISNATLSYSALPLVAAREWNLFQEQGVPGWKRDVPLLFSGDTLLFVPLIGINRACGQPGTEGGRRRRIAWQPDLVIA